MLDRAESTINVLLVEDVPEDAYIVRRMLRDVPGRNYVVQLADNVRGAREALSQPFDVCLLDMSLGPASGIDLLAGLDLNDLPGPVVVLTGQSSATAENSAYHAGVADFLSKSELSAHNLDRTIRYTLRQFEAARRFRFLAHHDDLTGLLNRRSYYEALQHLINTHGQAHVAVFYFDLDGFKSINDNWGHDLGDQVLKESARRIRSSFRRTDAVARHGGDEFVACMAPAPADGVKTVCQTLLRSLREPILAEGREFTVTASIGVACGAERVSDAADLVRHADNAMYQAKKTGRDTVYFAQYGEDPKVRDRAALALDLRTALSTEGLFLAYQPVIETTSRRVLGAEALLRWHHPQHGPVATIDIFTLAEEVGMIRAISDWVVQRAIKDLPELIEIGGDTFVLAINVIPQQLAQEGFAQFVLECLDASQVDVSRIRLELTEHAMVEEDALSRASIERLNQAGIALWIDDFGAGHSSLAYLSKLPVAGIKLDGHFLVDVPTSERSNDLLRAVLGIATTLNIDAVVENVDNKEQADYLTELACPAVQGFYYSPGVKLAAFRTYATQTGVAKVQPSES